MALALEARGIGVIRLAGKMGVSRTTISNWLNGRTQPRLNDLRAWAIETDVPLEWLTDGVVIPPADLTVVDGEATDAAPKAAKKAPRKRGVRAKAWTGDAPVVPLRRRA